MTKYDCILGHSIISGPTVTEFGIEFGPPYRFKPGENRAG